jgi:hypothetical protein
LNPEEIIAMPAGLELNALVKHAIGEGYKSKPAFYSTSWADAGPLLDSMPHEICGHFLTLRRGQNGIWRVLYDGGPGTELPVCEARTAPHAICLAVLLLSNEETVPTTNLTPTGEGTDK